MAPEMMTVNTVPNISNWSIENGYNDSDGRRQKTFYPIRVFNARQNAALFFFLQIYEHDIEYVCQGPVKGFKVFINTPGEILRSSWPSFRVSLFEYVELSIKATIMTTSDGLRSYRPNRRQCFFNSERRLQFFKIYTKNNCEIECLANFTLAKCGCVKFSMPRKYLQFDLLLLMALERHFFLFFRRKRHEDLWWFEFAMLQRCRKEIVWGKCR